MAKGRVATTMNASTAALRYSAFWWAIRVVPVGGLLAEPERYQRRERLDDVDPSFPKRVGE